MKTVRKKSRHKIDNRARIVKYVINRAKGLNKSESALSAGYPSATHTTAIEKTDTYKEVVKTYFKDVLNTEAGGTILSELARELLKVVRQDDDLGAKNAAIKTALEKLEPEDAPEEENDRVVVVLRPTMEAEATLLPESRPESPPSA